MIGRTGRVRKKKIEIGEMPRNDVLRSRGVVIAGGDLRDRWGIDEGCGINVEVTII